MNSLNEIVYFTIFIYLNEWSCLDYFEIHLHRVYLYTFIKEFAKSYSFSSAKNYSSSVLNVYTSHL